jgi:hypothetical protein
MIILLSKSLFYLAYSNIESLALLDECTKGANWLVEPEEGAIRIISIVPVKIKIIMNENIQKNVFKN